MNLSVFVEYTSGGSSNETLWMQAAIKPHFSLGRFLTLTLKTPGRQHCHIIHLLAQVLFEKPSDESLKCIKLHCFKEFWTGLPVSRSRTHSEDISAPAVKNSSSATGKEEGKWKIWITQSIHRLLGNGGHFGAALFITTLSHLSSGLFSSSST